MVGAAKILNATNTFFALLIFILSIVSLNGVNWKLEALKTVPWSYGSFTTDNPGVADSRITVAVYSNLWGSVINTYTNQDGDNENSKTEHNSSPCDEVPGVDDDTAALQRNGCRAYQLKDTLYALCILGFLFALFKTALAGVALCKPIQPVLIGNIVCSFFTWLWSLALWTLYYDQVFPQDNRFEFAGYGGFKYKMGSGLNATIAMCWFAFANIFVSIVHMVSAGKEEGGGGVTMQKGDGAAMTGRM